MEMVRSGVKIPELFPKEGVRYVHGRIQPHN